MKQYRKIFLVLLLLAAVVIGFIQCSDAAAADDPRGPEYAGAQSCVSCHASVNDHFHQSGHALTSDKVNVTALSRLITDSNNHFRYQDGGQVSTRINGEKAMQSLTMNGQPLRSAIMDIVVGSGEKARTYLSWNKDQLFQMPLTYISARHSWTNSPGYPVQQAYFDRLVVSRCLECHASFVGKEDYQSGSLEVSERLDPGSVIFGIDCERCHGPAAEHVAFHQDHPNEKKPHNLISIKRLPRERQLDLCASCHSGNDQDWQRSLFWFRPGDTLANYYIPSFGTGKEPDVHGRQYQLLLQSRCYQQSQLTCGTCHGGHDPLEVPEDIYTAKCMSCHQQSQHAVSLQADPRKCQACHMPLQASRKLIFDDGKGGEPDPYFLRNHRIAIYPDSVLGFIQGMKKSR